MMHFHQPMKHRIHRAAWVLVVLLVLAAAPGALAQSQAPPHAQQEVLAVRGASLRVGTGGAVARLALPADEKGSPPCQFIVQRESNLSFGQVMQGAGEVRKGKAESEIGMFFVQLKEKKHQQQLDVQLTGATGLSRENGGGASIHYDMRAAVRGAEEGREAAVPFCNSNSCSYTIVIPAKGRGQAECYQAYLHVYGAATVNYEPAGSYSGPVDLVLTLTRN